MNWILLILGGLFEVGFASCLGKMKEATGTPLIMWGIGFFTCLTISMLLLMKASQTLPIGTAYAVWTGIGAVGTVLVGILVFKEPATFWRIFFITTLIGSIVGLKFVSSH
ncbi:DMT family transporter [Chitinophaga nivalis]|uniref:Guanidinium exporter n=1 Tax=Chitinophaga nivalis TaxID=2991709 RepID=A0ABT3IH90_9BACT|nr:multidrug efflux SMR transporter [Chitinophaga nivalis]MCW3467179.1 multidrug efflux SMR transporter [Chitinophaga nivalis]MCW3483129.1 multidrug efflux SMR transporter [Chitinophaga nivalis]